MIANISPAVSSCEHTLNTLRYSERIKELKKQTAGSKPFKERELGLARLNKSTFNPVSQAAQLQQIQQLQQFKLNNAPVM